MLIALASSVSAFASPTIMEFDQGQEMKCNSEAQTLGCTNGAGEEVSSCVEAKKAKLSKECQGMHSIKSKNK